MAAGKAADLPPVPQSPTDSPSDDGQWLELITRDFKRLQMQKSRKTGGVEARILTALAFLWGEQYLTQQARGLVVEPSETNKLYLVFNLIDSAFSKLCGRITSLGGSFYSRPDKKDAKAASEAKVVDKLILALDEKVDQPTRTWELVYNLLSGGVAFEYVPWIPDATTEPVPQFDDQGELLFTTPGPDGEPMQVPQSVRDQQVAAGVAPEKFVIYEEVESAGDVGSEVLNGLQVFIDHSVRSVEDLAPDQAIYIAKIRTHGWIEENFGPQDDLNGSQELNIVSTTVYQDGDASASLFLKDLIPTIQGEVGPDDPPMSIVVERFQPTSSKNPHGKFTVFVPGEKILFDGDNPYGDIPIVDFHFRPVVTTFWTKDYITDLIAPQKFLNKRLSQLGEQANASIYDKILLGGSLGVKDLAPDRPQAIEKAITETGAPLIQRLNGPQLPGWFLDSVNLTVKMFQQIAGGNDLFAENSFPGQMRGPMAIPMLQEILDSEWGPLYKHLGKRMAKVKQMRMNRVKQFYEPIRTLHYTDHNDRDEVMVFHTDQVLKSGTNFNITIEQGGLAPELRAQKEDRVMQRLSGPLSILYTDDRTGKVDKSKVAQDLGMSDFGREDKESQSRTFAQQIIEKLWVAQDVPPVMQFWDHEPMLDELESEMMTTEFLSASQPVQQLFIDRWNQHSAFLNQRAQMQMESIQSHVIQGAVAQAVQSAAAQTVSETIQASKGQIAAQIQQTPPNLASQLHSQAQFPTAGRPAPGPTQPPLPQQLQRGPQ